MSPNFPGMGCRMNILSRLSHFSSLENIFFLFLETIFHFASRSSFREVNIKSSDMESKTVAAAISLKRRDYATLCEGTRMKGEAGNTSMDTGFRNRRAQCRKRLRDLLNIQFPFILLILNLSEILGQFTPQNSTRQSKPTLSSSIYCCRGLRIRHYARGVSD